MRPVPVHNGSPSQIERPNVLSRKPLLAFLVALVIGLMSLGWTGAAAVPGGSAGNGTTYYVDAANGDDEAPGTNPAAAWQTLDKVNATTFGPGDRVLLRSGQSWTGQLWPKGSGSDGNPIVVDRYGPGAKPAIHGAGELADAVRLHNQEHWVLRNLEVTNEVPLGDGEPGTNLGDFRGIHISGDVGGTLSGIRIDVVDVHDVTGEVNWIGGSTGVNEPGITFRTGWDRSKNTGGIVVRGLAADPSDPGEPTVFDDVVVENSTVKRTSFAGIIVKQHVGNDDDAVHVGWGERTSRDDARFAPHTNVVIRNNFITHDGTDYGANGIYLTGTQGGLVESNVVYRTGTSGIEMYNADDVVVQYNEVYETEQKAGGADSNGIDPDIATTNIVVQYNFVHHNGDGILLCQCGRGFGDSIVRNNVVASNDRYPIYLHSVRGTAAVVYNNTIYNDSSNHLVYSFGQYLEAEYHLWNNVFYSTRANASLTTSPTIDYKANLYGGAELAIPTSDPQPVVGDPMFAGQITGPYGTEASGPRLDSALSLQLTSGSRGVGMGIDIEDNGGVDYAGAELYNGLPDIGAFEYRTPAGQAWESVNGFVHDQFGNPVGSAEVVLESHDKVFQTSTEEDGFYRISHVPFGGQGALTVSRDDHVTSSGTVVVSRGDTLRHDVTLITTLIEGTIEGRVLDERAQPLVDVQVSVLSGGDPVATASSDATGAFTIAGLPPSSDYTVSAEVAGRHADERSGVSVTAGQVTDIGALILAAEGLDVTQEHTFDQLPLGPFADGTDGWRVSTGSGNDVDLVAAPSEIDQSVKLTRTSNTGDTPGTNAALPFDEPLTGLITIDASVMRDDPYVSGNHWFGLPYVYNTDGTQALSVAFNRGDIIAYNGTSSSVLGQYELGRWYQVRLVIDTVNQRFDLLIDGETYISDGEFRNAMPAIGSMSFYANSSNYGSAYVDDVRISYGRG
jgi:parallel beta-helix repeat protein